jgi:hypothetical protein
MAKPGEPEAAEPSRKHYIYSEERNVISNVIQGCVKECEEDKLLYPIIAPIRRASFYTCVPRRTVQRIKRELENNPECVIESTLKRRRPSKKKAKIASLDRNVIRMTVEDFYIWQKIVPSVRKLLAALKQKNRVFMAKRRPYSRFT